MFRDPHPLSHLKVNKHFEEFSEAAQVKYLKIKLKKL